MKSLSRKTEIIIAPIWLIGGTRLRKFTIHLEDLLPERCFQLTYKRDHVESLLKDIESRILVTNPCLLIIDIIFNELLYFTDKKGWQVDVKLNTKSVFSSYRSLLSLLEEYAHFNKAKIVFVIPEVLNFHVVNRNLRSRGASSVKRYNNESILFLKTFLRGFALLFDNGHYPNIIGFKISGMSVPLDLARKLHNPSLPTYLGDFGHLVTGGIKPKSNTVVTHLFTLRILKILKDVAVVRTCKEADFVDQDIKQLCGQLSSIVEVDATWNISAIPLAKYYKSLSSYFKNLMTCTILSDSKQLFSGNHVRTPRIRTSDISQSKASFLTIPHQKHFTSTRNKPSFVDSSTNTESVSPLCKHECHLDLKRKIDSIFDVVTTLSQEMAWLQQRVSGSGLKIFHRKSSSISSLASSSEFDNDPGKKVTASEAECSDYTEDNSFAVLDLSVNKSLVTSLAETLSLNPEPSD